MPTKDELKATINVVNNITTSIDDDMREVSELIEQALHSLRAAQCVLHEVLETRELEGSLPDWDPSLCNCPAGNPPCSYCEDGNYKV
jgi:hypothetical protein